MSVFITGDLHGDFKDIQAIPERCPIGERDILLVAGDFGVPWYDSYYIKGWRKDREILDWFDHQPYITAFVDGNHENFDNLYARPVEEKWGGKVHKINDHVFHLCRGEVFDFLGDGKKTFVFGGATSVDKEWRTEGESWWSEENASQEEMDYGKSQLEALDWNIDYVITHTAPKQFTPEFYKYMSFKLDVPCPTQNYLTELADCLTWKKWYFGHFHGDDKSIEQRARLLYDDIVLFGD